MTAQYGAVLPYTGSTPPVTYTPPEPEARDAQSMTPTDFVLWLNGAIDVLNDTPPTQEQWNVMREKIAGQVGAIISQRIRAAANPYAATAQEVALKQQQMQLQASLAKWPSTIKKK